MEDFRYTKKKYILGKLSPIQDTHNPDLPRLIESLVEASQTGCYSDGSKKKPGRIIKSLTKEEREAIASSTSKDWNRRWK